METTFAVKDKLILETARQVGKLTQEALYIHRTAIELLAEGLKAAVKKAIVLIPQFNITLIKIHRHKDAISFLEYPNFDSNPHPVLRTGAIVQNDSVKITDYSQRKNPPLLHRKECFVGPTYPRRVSFVELTNAEEKAALLTQTSTIGTREGWQQRLTQMGYHIEGHRLCASVDGVAL